MVDEYSLSRHSPYNIACSDSSMVDEYAYAQAVKS